MQYHALPPNMPTELMGPMLQGPAEIKSLQQALLNLSQATQNPAINPGAITGDVTPQTVQAVIAGQQLISSELPSWAFVSLQAALAAGAMTSQAKTAIAAAAVPLTVAANTAAVKYKKTSPIPGGSAIVGFFAPGWYKTPMGIALIAVGAFAGYKLFFAPKTA